MIPAMTKAAELKTQRRAQAHAATRGSIIEAARRVAARDGSREMSLRGVAAEAGFAPAALYGYFSGKDDLLLALAADDLSHLSRAMRDASREAGPGKLSAAASAALSILRETESVAAALGALPANGGGSEAERLFNGRMIAALKVLSEASGNQAATTRDEQCDVVLVAAAVTGLAMLARSGRLDALGFKADEVLARLDARFTP